jgi:RNA polymerase sigma-70 factor (ECF subfamily)
MSAESSDEELLASGGAQGFGLLYERRYPLIRGYLRRRVGRRPELVLDLVAETFARALERREQFDPQRGPAVGWLLGIAHHLLLDAVRHGRVADESRRRVGMERILVEDAQLELVERDSESDLQRALAALPVEQRQLRGESPVAVVEADHEASAGCETLAEPSCQATSCAPNPIASSSGGSAVTRPSRTQASRLASRSAASTEDVMRRSSHPAPSTRQGGHRVRKRALPLCNVDETSSAMPTLPHLDTCLHGRRGARRMCDPTAGRPGSREPCR